MLEKAGIGKSARQVSFEGMDRPVLPGTPEFVKALDAAHAMDGEVMLAYAMNGADLPLLNGYPVRLVVPGHYGTYWIKHLADITVLDKEFDGYWMQKAYRIPDNDCACTPVGKAPEKTRPIGRYNVRSFITSLADGARLPLGQAQRVRGIAFDGGRGIREVQFSADGGKTWRAAQLGQDLGRYSFREWQADFRPERAGAYELKARATNMAGETQPLEALWNPPATCATWSKPCASPPPEEPVMNRHLLALAGALAMLSPAHALDIQLPAETATLHPGASPGAQSAAQCLMCHSVDYLSTQPPMPLGFWEAEVKKMVAVYGAPIAPDQAQLIIQYLNQAYPAPAAPAAAK